MFGLLFLLKLLLCLPHGLFELLRALFNLLFGLPLLLEQLLSLLCRLEGGLRSTIGLLQLTLQIDHSRLCGDARGSGESMDFVAKRVTDLVSCRKQREFNEVD